MSTPFIADADRVVEYAPVASTGPFPVPFPVFEETGADLFVTLNGELVTNWSATATTMPGFYGAPNTYLLELMFDAAITGALLIEGRRAPRRVSQFGEGRGIPSRDHNSELNTLTAIAREQYRRQNRIETNLGLIDQAVASTGADALAAGEARDGAEEARDEAVIAADEAANSAGFRDFKDVATLLANTSLAYGGGASQVAAGDIIRTRRRGYSYIVAASGASDQDVTTAGGVKLYVLPGANGFDIRAFGAKGDGVTNDTAPILKALLKGGQVYVPNGVYMVGNLPCLGGAGLHLIFESMWNAVFKVIAGTTGSILVNQVAATGTSAYHRLVNVGMDLNQQNVIGIDLASINNTTVESPRIFGAPSKALATGRGIRFGAPLDSGAYSNCVINPTMRYLSAGIQWGNNANQNVVIAGECTLCLTGLDIAPGTYVDTPRVFGTRIEGNDVGMREGATYGFYAGLRFEANGVDVTFATTSFGPHFSGGYSASSPIVLQNINNSTAPIIHASDLGWYEIENSASRPKQLQGKHIYSAAGSAIPTAPSGTYAAFFDGEAWFKNGTWLRSMNAAGNGQVLMAQINTSNELVLRALNGGTDERINIGAGASVRPLGDNATASGEAARRWSVVFAGTGTISTSDAREKTDVRPLTSVEISAASELAREIGIFQFLSSVEEKGEAARLHVGMTVQRVIEIMDSYGLNPFGYGFICYDEWEETPEEWATVTDEDGNESEVKISEYQAAGNRYSFRSDQLDLFISRGQTQRQDDLEARIAALENTVIAAL
jgi:hypothetical protein